MQLFNIHDKKTKRGGTKGDSIVICNDKSNVNGEGRSMSGERRERRKKNGIN
jgi:hypothetical protein